MSRYPILHPHIHLNDLNDDLCLLTNYRNYKTKKLNKYQKAIIKTCDGSKSIEEIKSTITTSNPGIPTHQIDQYIQNLINWGFLTWSPQKVKGLKTSLSYMSNIPKFTSELTPTSMIAITISILDSCCLKCEYCSQNAPIGKSHLIPFDKVIEILDDAYDLGAQYLGVFGGEPMMHPDVYEIIQYAHLKGYKKVLLFTRGTLIDELAAKRLHSVGIQSLQLTADSHIPEHYDRIVGVPGSFNRMFKAIYYLHSVGIEIIMKIIATKKNIADIPSMVLYFRDLGIEKFNIEAVVPVGRASFTLVPSKEELDCLQMHLDKITGQFPNVDYSLAYLSYGKPKKCAGGIGEIIVFADGDTGPCDKSYFIKDQIGFGNINKQSLKEIWKGQRLKEFRELKNDDPRCRLCKDADSCLGGCILNSYIKNDSQGPDPMCSLISGKDQGIFPID